MPVDGIGGICVELERTDVGKTLKELIHVSGARRFRHIAEPGETGATQIMIVGEKRIDRCDLRGNQSDHQSVSRLLAGLRATGKPDTLDRLRAGQDDLG